MNRIDLMNEVTEKMTKGLLTPTEGWHCLKAVARRMTAEEHKQDEAYAEGYLDHVLLYDLGAYMLRGA